MENILKKKIYSVCRFDKKDFLENNQEINDLMLRILVSHETNDDNFNMQKSKDYIQDLNLDIMTKDYVDVRLYMLLDEKNNVPVCFALFSQDNTRDDWHLEYISTNKEYCERGFAENLFMCAAKDIANTEFPYISSVVNEDNYASNSLHEAISKKDGIKAYYDTIDDEDELCDSYEDEQYESYFEEDDDDALYDSERDRCSNRYSYLFDVSELRNQEKFDIEDTVLM